MSKDKKMGYVMAFHRRRLMETEDYYEQLLRCVGDLPENPTQEEISNRRLLVQPLAYHVLVLIWASSKYSRDDGTQADDVTAYSVAQAVSRRREDHNKTVNYVGRVIDAAEAFDLVVREKSADDLPLRYFLRGTANLNALMTNFALRFLDGSSE